MRCKGPVTNAGANASQEKPPGAAENGDVPHCVLTGRVGGSVMVRVCMERVELDRLTPVDDVIYLGYGL